MAKLPEKNKLKGIGKTMTALTMAALLTFLSSCGKPKNPVPQSKSTTQTTEQTENKGTGQPTESKQEENSPKSMETAQKEAVKSETVVNNEEATEFLSKVLEENLGISELPPYNETRDGNLVGIELRGMGGYYHKLEGVLGPHILTNGPIIIGMVISDGIELEKTVGSTYWPLDDNNILTLDTVYYAAYGWNFDADPSSFNNAVKSIRENNGLLPPSLIYLKFMEHPEENINVSYMRIIEDVESTNDFVMMKIHNLADTNGDGIIDIAREATSMRLSAKLDPREQVYLTDVGQVPYYNEFLTMKYKDLVDVVEERCVWHTSDGDLPFVLMEKNSKAMVYNLDVSEFPFWEGTQGNLEHLYMVQGVPFQFAIVNCVGHNGLVVRTGLPVSFRGDDPLDTTITHCRTYVDYDPHGEKHVLRGYNPNTDHMVYKPETSLEVSFRDLLP